MKFHVVAIPLIAAICLGSPAFAGAAERANGDDQRRRDRGADNRRSGRSAPRPRIAYSAYSAYSAYGAYGTFGAYGAPYYAYPPYGGGYDLGGVRLRIRPRDAQVFVDGYYAGVVDDFDGTFQQLRLEQGGHKIEIRMPGFEDLEMDVHVQPGRTITLHEDLRPRP